MARYLYNGKEAPELPVWDRKKYPHAYMYRDTTSYYVFFSTVPLIYHPIYQNGVLIANAVVASEQFQHLETKTSGYNDATGYWDIAWDELPTEPTTVKADSYHSIRSRPFWCNTDMMLDGEDTLFLAASNPINAETGEEIDYSPIPVPVYDPEALLQGYLVGCRIRAMRGKKKPVLSGVWKFHEQLTQPPFVTAEQSHTENINCYADGSIRDSKIKLVYYDALGLCVYYGDRVFAEYEQGAWVAELWRTVDFGTEPQTVSAEFYGWFIANAERQ